MKSSPRLFWKQLESLWQAFRHVTGDDAYERYLRHWQGCKDHADGQQTPLDRKSFHQYTTQRRWNGIKRCC